MFLPEIINNTSTIFLVNITDNLTMRLLCGNFLHSLEVHFLNSGLCIIYCTFYVIIKVLKNFERLA